MNNDIIPFVNFDTEGLIFKELTIEGNTKTLHFIKKLEPTYCEICGYRMHSKGLYKRSINHPILQDGYCLYVKIERRSWYCTNPKCRHHCLDTFSFAPKYKHNSNQTIFMILDAMRNINLTTAEIAQRFNVSDTYVHETFLRYVNCDRLPLPRILSVDEVYLNFNDRNRYALVLMDFESGEIVDILPNRLKDSYQKYFQSIPLEERNKVEILICDMYDPYVNFSINYLHKAKVVLDSFHVVQWINRKINNYINQIKKKYQERDEKELMRRNLENNRNDKSRKQSREVYVLNHYRWVLLSNRNKPSKHAFRKYNRFFKQYLDVYDYEKMFMELDESFLLMRNLKDLYDDFNDALMVSEEEKKKELEHLIEIYRTCDLSMFQEFGDLLDKHKNEIINSFITINQVKIEEHEKRVNKTTQTIRRMSNGPIESFNRKPKDFKRNSRGFSNPEYVIKRILWSTRKNEHVRAVPKSDDYIKSFKGKIRGEYKK